MFFKCLEQGYDVSINHRFGYTLVPRQSEDSKGHISVKTSVILLLYVPTIVFTILLFLKEPFDGK